MPPSSPSVAERPLTVALIGNPNTGKSMLFNALAGMNARVANYPCVTGEKKIGRTSWRSRGTDAPESSPMGRPGSSATWVRRPPKAAPLSR